MLLIEVKKATQEVGIVQKKAFVSPIICLPNGERL